MRVYSFSPSVIGARYGYIGGGGLQAAYHFGGLSLRDPLRSNALSSGPNATKVVFVSKVRVRQRTQERSSDHLRSIKRVKGGTSRQSRKTTSYISKQEGKCAGSGGVQEEFRRGSGGGQEGVRSGGGQEGKCTGSGGVQEGFRRSSGGVQEGVRRGNVRVQEGVRRGSGGEMCGLSD
eukprot:1195302-Prorocentrum_minimum.AAC.6